MPTLKDKIVFLYDHRRKLDGYMYNLIVKCKARLDRLGRLAEFGYKETNFIERAYARMSHEP